MSWTEEDVARRNREVFGAPPMHHVGDDAQLDRMLESEIEAECTKLLEEDGWRALRTDPVSDRSRGKGFGEPGMADHLYIRYAYSKPIPQMILNVMDPAKFNARARATASEVMWIEFKRPGEKAKKHQQEWHAKERSRGACTLIAGQDFPATLEGFRAWYQNSGLKRSR